ncbi:MAG: 5'/3'-nucleotidase SurE, partial [Spirochaetaceae bacterium]
TAYAATVDILDFSDNEPLILVTNDDGVLSPGLHAAIEAVQDLGHVLVAAPTEQQTARGRSMVGNPSDHFHPTTVEVDGAEVTAFHLAASPALVVRHAFAVLCGGRMPDLVVSGINYGENLGNNITISGTVGAAFQAAAQGVPAIAVSRQTDIEHHFVYGDLDWEEPIRVTRRYAQRLLELSLGRTPGELLPFDVLKIDVPHNCPVGTEERITRLSRRHYFHTVVPEPRVDGKLSDGVTTIQIDRDALNPEDDIYAFAVDRVVSVTPLTLDCTASLARADAALRDTALST